MFHYRKNHELLQLRKLLRQHCRDTIESENWDDRLTNGEYSEITIKKNYDKQNMESANMNELTVAQHD